MEKQKIVLPHTQGGCVYSQGIRYGNMLLVSGQVGEDKNGVTAPDIRSQTEQAILNAKEIIEAAGGSLKQVLMCQCFLQKEEDFSGMNEVYAQFFCGEGEIPPARYTVAASPLDKKYLLEISKIVGL